MTKKLLVERSYIDFTNLDENSQDPTATRIRKLSDGRYSVRALGQLCDKVNKNNRVYPSESTWGKHTLPESDFQSRVKARRIIGHTEHPSDGKSSMPMGAVVVTKVEKPRPGGEVMIEFETMSTPAGRVVEAYIRDGVGFGLSSRGNGSVNTRNDGVDEVQEDFEPVTFDCVIDESTSGAEVVSQKLREGLRRLDAISMTLMESADGDAEKARRLDAALVSEAIERDRRISEDYEIGSTTHYEGTVVDVECKDEQEAKKAKNCLEKAGFHCTFKDDDNCVCVYTAYNNSMMAKAHIHRLLKAKKLEPKEESMATNVGELLSDITASLKKLESIENPDEVTDGRQVLNDDVAESVDGEEEFEEGEEDIDEMSHMMVSVNPSKYATSHKRMRAMKHVKTCCGGSDHDEGSYEEMAPKPGMPPIGEMGYAEMSHGMDDEGTYGEGYQAAMEKMGYSEDYDETETDEDYDEAEEDPDLGGYKNRDLDDPEDLDLDLSYGSKFYGPATPGTKGHRGLDRRARRGRSGSVRSRKHESVPGSVGYRDVRVYFNEAGEVCDVQEALEEGQVDESIDDDVLFVEARAYFDEDGDLIEVEPLLDEENLDEGMAAFFAKMFGREDHPKHPRGKNSKKFKKYRDKYKRPSMGKGSGHDWDKKNVRHEKGGKRFERNPKISYKARKLRPEDYEDGREPKDQGKRRSEVLSGGWRKDTRGGDSKVGMSSRAGKSYKDVPWDKEPTSGGTMSKGKFVPGGKFKPKKGAGIFVTVRDSKGRKVKAMARGGAMTHAKGTLYATDAQRLQQQALGKLKRISGRMNKKTFPQDTSNYNVRKAAGTLEKGAAVKMKYGALRGLAAKLEKNKVGKGAQVNIGTKKKPKMVGTLGSLLNMKRKRGSGRGLSRKAKEMRGKDKGKRSRKVDESVDQLDEETFNSAIEMAEAIVGVFSEALPHPHDVAAATEDAVTLSEVWPEDVTVAVAESMYEWANQYQGEIPELVGDLAESIYPVDDESYLAEEEYEDDEGLEEDQYEEEEEGEIVEESEIDEGFEGGEEYVGDPEYSDARAQFLENEIVRLETREQEHLNSVAEMREHLRKSRVEGKLEMLCFQHPILERVKDKLLTCESEEDLIEEVNMYLSFVSESNETIKEAKDHARSVNGNGNRQHRRLDGVPDGPLAESDCSGPMSKPVPAPSTFSVIAERRRKRYLASE